MLPRHDDGVARQIGGERPVRAAHQLAQQPVGEIVEIVQPVAQERVGLARHLARVSFCTRSTAASAVRPFLIASCSRPLQPRSSANIL